jgi:N-acetylmuramoyl-L-alanine amidase
VKFLTLFQALRNILSRRRKKKVSRNSCATPRDWRRSEVVGICIGHSRRGDRGAINHDDTTDEWTYNLSAGEALHKSLKNKGIPSRLYSHYGGGSYSAAMRDIKRRFKEDHVTLALELHFNSYNGSAHGSETWYRFGAPKGKKLASFLQRSIINAYGTRDRGVKASKRGTRGYGFLSHPDIPKVLCEPFFGDNKKDYLLFSKPEELGQPLADGIENFLLDKHTSNLSARKDNATE